MCKVCWQYRGRAACPMWPIQPPAGRVSARRVRFLGGGRKRVDCAIIGDLELGKYSCRFLEMWRKLLLVLLMSSMPGVCHPQLFPPDTPDIPGIALMLEALPDVDLFESLDKIAFGSAERWRAIFAASQSPVPSSPSTSSLSAKTSGMLPQRWLGALIRLCLASMNSPTQLTLFRSRFGDDNTCLAEVLAEAALPYASRQLARAAACTAAGSMYDPQFGDVGAHAARLLALRVLAMPVRAARSPGSTCKNSFCYFSPSWRCNIVRTTDLWCTAYAEYPRTRRRSAARCFCGGRLFCANRNRWNCRAIRACRTHITSSKERRPVYNRMATSLALRLFVLIGNLKHACVRQSRRGGDLCHR